MAYSIKKTVDLAQFGWEGCELVFNSLSYDELQRLQTKYRKPDPDDTKAVEEILEILKSKYVSGEGLSDGKKVDVHSADLGQLPFEIIQEVIVVLTGNNPDPKL
jgi:hypothetical protein